MLDFSEKSVMVTGGAGFIGSTLVERLLKEPVSKLTAVDNLFLGKLANIEVASKDKRFTFLGADAGDPNLMERILTTNKIDIVFNLAVIPLLASLEFPRSTYEQNVRIATNICELARSGLFKTLIHCSSSEAYGTAKRLPMTEDHPMNPTTPYAASKAASDLFIMAYTKTFGIEATIIRPFNAYGPRQNDGSYAAVIPITINKIANGQQPVIYGDGLQTRDYTYVTDIVEGLLAGYTHEQSRGRVINVASGKELTIKHLITEICRTMKYDGEIAYLPTRTADVRRHKASLELAKGILNYSPKVTLADGLKLTVEWFERKNAPS